MATRTIVICIDNSGYTAALEVRTLYEVLPDGEAEAHEQARIIDESGEDYLYPKASCTRVSLPQEMTRKLVHAT